VLTGLIVLGVVLVLSSAFGLWRKRTDGTVRIEGVHERGVHDRSVHEQGGEPAQQAEDATALTAERLGRTLGSRATLLQFSSAFCAPCRATKVILADVASKVDGVAHIEIDAESHLELVREVGILRTPTTLVLDDMGRITARASGVPRREQVLAALDVSVR
jgi:thiol-disulfide isomerase/thioredoxin